MRYVAGLIIFYSLTTPVGMAIGIGAHESYNEDNTQGLLARGILDCLAAGILVYEALVNIIAPHFSSKFFDDSTHVMKAIQIFSFWLGAGIMSFIGKYA